MQKNQDIDIAKFSRIFNAILVHCQKFSGWQGKELEFVGRGNIPHSMRVWMICRSP
jgi:hypothetical protein